MVKKKKEKRGAKQKRESTVFELLMFRFFPYWPLFAILCGVMMILASLYVELATPGYEVTATLLIKDEKKGAENSSMAESLNILTSKKIVENEIEVIKSRTLVRETIERLHLCTPVFEEGIFSAIPAYTTSPVAVEVKDVDRITEEQKVDFTFDAKTLVVTLNEKDYKLDEWINSPFGEIRFVRNNYQKEIGIGPYYVSFIDPRKVMKAMLDNLSVQASNKLATVVNLSVRDEVPLRGENILNTLIDSYNRAAVNDKNILAANTLEFVEERIKLVERDLDSLELSIQQYKSNQGIVDLSEQGKVFLKNVGDNDQKLAELDMQMAVLNKAEDYVVQRETSSKIVPASLGINDDALTTLIGKLYESETEYARLRKTTAENNPILISLLDEIAELRPGILENIRNQKSSLIASRAKLNSTNVKYASALMTIPKKERELLEANRQQVIKNNVYTFLLQKREEAALTTGATVGDSRLVDKAESSLDPVAPNKILTYAGAFALACFFGVVWVTKKELLSNKILFRSDIEAITNIPVAAEIADSRMRNYVVIDNLKKPYLTEQFIQLRAAIGLHSTCKNKIMMVTSSIAGEGKSFISTNFAISLAGSNKKILLIDMDLRNPRLSHLYNAGNGIGMSEFLLGEKPIEKVVRRTATHNLFLISAGSRRAKATEMLLDGNVSQLFTRLKTLFDFIIVDTPPIAPVIDGFVISPYCDATLFVVRHGKTPKRILQMLDEDSKLNTIKNIFIVFNGVKQRGLIESEYGYGYGSGYHYGYAEPKSKGFFSLLK